MKIRSSLLALLCLGLLSACGDDSDGSAIPMQSDAFIAGYYQTAGNDYKPCVWVNGTRNDLSVSDEGQALALATDGRHLYTAGAYFTDPASPTACYWQNSTLVDLDPVSTGTVTDIYVHGGVIQVVGLDSGDIFYWNSNTKTRLTLGKQAGTTLPRFYASSGTTLVTGRDTAGTSAVYWSMTSATSAKPADTAAIAGQNSTAIWLDGSTVYRAGWTAANLPCFWQDGVQTILDDDASLTAGYATAIKAVDGSLTVTGLCTYGGVTNRPFVYRDTDTSDASAGSLTVLSSLKVNGADQRMGTYFYGLTPFLLAGFDEGGAPVAGYYYSSLTELDSAGLRAWALDLLIY